MTRHPTLAVEDLTDAPTRHSLTRLGDLSGPCVSVYLPTRRDPDHDALVLRGLLEDAAARLRSRQVAEATIEDVIGPLHTLVEDRRFWSRQGAGVALFADRHNHLLLGLPHPVSPHAVVGTDPHLVPLVPRAAFGHPSAPIAGQSPAREVRLETDRSSAAPDGTGGGPVDGDQFYLLAVSTGRVRLFEGGTRSLRELHLGSIPRSVEAMQRRSGRHPRLQSLARRAASATLRSHTGPSQATVHAFLHEVAAGVRTIIGADNTRPVVLAGSPEYLPVLRETQLLPTLMDEVLAGPSRTTAWQLYKKAVPVVRRYGGSSTTNREVSIVAAERRTDLLRVTDR